MAETFNKPVKLSGDWFDSHPGGVDPAIKSQLAQETAWSLLQQARNSTDSEVLKRILAYTAEHGLADIAQLWEDADPHSLPGVLWRLYTIRRAAEISPAATTQLYRTGYTLLAPAVEPAVAGIADPVTPERVLELCDTVFRGVFAGDFAAGLDRAWAYCKVVSLGAAHLSETEQTASPDPQHQSQQLDTEHARNKLLRHSLQYLQYATDLQAAAALWRSGKLD